jgi:hypothetical protein
MFMQSELSENWPKYLPIVIANLNNTPVHKLGNIAPIEVNTYLDDYKIREAQLAQNITPVLAPTLQERNKNEETFNQADSSFKTGDLVYLDFKESAFSKQYLKKVSKIIKITIKLLLVRFFSKLKKYCNT